MGRLSVDDQIGVATMNGQMLRLLQLDDLWTAAVTDLALPREQTAASSDAPKLAREMIESLKQMGEHVDLLQRVGEVLGEDGEDHLNHVLWSTDLTETDRADLRWVATRAGGFQALAHGAAETLSAHESEVDLLEQQLTLLERGDATSGDLSRKYRCGLGQGLIVGGVVSVPATAVAAAGTGVTLGALGAGVLVAATGGIAGIAVVVAGLLFIRKARC